MTGRYNAAAELTNLAGWIDEQLADEGADRQWIAETAAFRVRDVTLAMLGDAELHKGEVTLTAGQAEDVLGALADAATYRRRQAGEACAGCDANPDEGVCPDHLDDIDLADAYDGLARELRQEAAR
jgi:hypothetical protein